MNDSLAVLGLTLMIVWLVLGSHHISVIRLIIKFPNRELTCWDWKGEHHHHHHHQYQQDNYNQCGNVAE